MNQQGCGQRVALVMGWTGWNFGSTLLGKTKYYR